MSDWPRSGLARAESAWPPDDLGDVVSLLAPDPADASVLSWAALLLAGAYGWGVLALRRRHRRFPMWRAVSFGAGCVLLWAITGSGVEQYARALFSMFMVQQLTLMIVVPSLLVLGAPGRVLLSATPHRGPGRLVVRCVLGAIRGRVVRLALHPVVAVGLFLAAYYGLYLTGLAPVVLRQPGGDLALECFFLAAGVLLAVPVLSAGPLPRRVTHGERAVDVFVEMALHAFFGVLIMVSTSLLVPAFAVTSRALGIDPMADQAVAGGIAWSYGEGPAVLTLLYVMERWFRSETRAAQGAGPSPDTEDSEELTAYNAYLARLAEDRRSP